MRHRKPQQLVTLFAGMSPNRFVVHKDFACHYAPVLEAAFNGKFIEGHTQVYKFQDTGEEAVRLLVHWLYTQKLDTIVLNDLHKQGGSENHSKHLNSQSRAMVELWVLCERLLIPRLQNEIITEIERVRKHTQVISISNLKYVYENTPSDSPLRRVHVDYCVAHCISSISYSKYPDRYPQEMLLDMVKRFTKVISNAQRFKVSPGGNMAAYHVVEDLES
ncbi:hypothetical protein BKA65DRAFT_472250 [Rhexocercosporidium sp. MPI-PUGE-AT-0058]|nr:hypothetical protein BKA65DRAFT_472250 [Rhexocercosporidium sp. MPI-PUGE-AT-0058]